MNIMSTSLRPILLDKVAYHTITGQKVAMKFLSKEAIIASRTKMRVQREVEYMRMLRHPHIIKLSVCSDSCLN